jgi:CheY-like chemotaxis protein
MIVQKDRILVVEDSTSWQATLSHLLENEGFEVDIASTYSSGLEQVLRDEDLPDDMKLSLVICDLRLVEHDDTGNFDGLGLVALCALRQIPTVVVSGYLASDVRHALVKEFGVTTFLHKASFREEQFVLEIHRLTNRSHVSNLRNEVHQESLGDYNLTQEVRTLGNLLVERYTTAFHAINEHYRKRCESAGQLPAIEKAPWIQELDALDKKFHDMHEQLARTRTRMELERIRVHIHQFPAENQLSYSMA